MIEILKKAADWIGRRLSEQPDSSGPHKYKVYHIIEEYYLDTKVWRAYEVRKTGDKIDKIYVDGSVSVTSAEHCEARLLAGPQLPIQKVVKELVL